ncbi:7-cyano-7-deazaguanine synthase QueC [Alienimonas californiensis]|uniref:7-cyano-7-deazaguanine synthase n=1 Tax=Alienimonas californiensis TaxID=2527989 RepID=A0A517P3R3_9PLAN|nr:7-cyano-7-deazaguanine synthase QueC [Alienimonas californiensis]QDT14009.1 7-cyano-7-deazaguanine synthase [Alienimonas californiensis]
MSETALSATAPSGAAPAVVLLSGGLDSATVLACCVRDGFAPHALSFDYGQRHRTELDAARRVAKAGGAVRQEVIELNLSQFGGSALTDNFEVPKDRDESTMAAEIPITYVPARNTVFLSVALGWAEVLGAKDIYVGVNAVDYSGYPDCRPEFLRAFETLANLATKAGVEGDRFQVHAPLIDLTKAEIIALGLSLNVDYGLTHSCYDPVDGRACGRCDSCRLRLAGFEAAGATDPAPYAVRSDA